MDDMFSRVGSCVLEFKQLQSFLEIDGRVLANAEITTHRNMAYDFQRRLCMQLTAYIASKQLKEVTHSYPASGWDLFKLYFFPKWFKNKYPVEYLTIKIEALEVYPEISMPERNPFIMLHKYTNGVEQTYPNPNET